MKTEQTLLIDDLIKRTRDLVSRVETMASLPADQLNYRNPAQSWCALECLEHVNLFGDFYLKEIEKRIGQAKDRPGESFKSGLLGGYFAEAMLPGNGEVRRIKTFKGKDPMHTGLPHAAIDRFLEQQRRMIELLEMAREVDIDRVKASISFPRFIKLKLGDVFRVVVYHGQRHVVQAERALENWGLAGMFV